MLFPIRPYVKLSNLFYWYFVAKVMKWLEILHEVSLYIDYLIYWIYFKSICYFLDRMNLLKPQSQTSRSRWSLTAYSSQCIAAQSEWLRFIVPNIDNNSPRSLINIQVHRKQIRDWPKNANFHHQRERQFIALMSINNHRHKRIRLWV